MPGPASAQISRDTTFTITPSFIGSLQQTGNFYPIYGRAAGGAFVRLEVGYAIPTVDAAAFPYLTGISAGLTMTIGSGVWGQQYPSDEIDAYLNGHMQASMLGAHAVISPDAYATEAYSIVHSGNSSIIHYTSYTNWTLVAGNNPYGGQPVPSVDQIDAGNTTWDRGGFALFRVVLQSLGTGYRISLGTHSNASAVAWVSADLLQVQYTFDPAYMARVSTSSQTLTSMGAPIVGTHPIFAVAGEADAGGQLPADFVAQLPPEILANLPAGITAVPEPATIALVGVGLLGLGAGARRRRMN